jgi:hypothetical protein
MTSQLDVQEAAYSGAMNVRKWAQEWLEEWNRPRQEMMQAKGEGKLLAFWSQLPEEAHAAMQRENPEGYAKAKQMIAEMRKKVTK